MSVDEFLKLAEPSLTVALREVGPNTGTRRWIAVMDAQGMALTSATDESSDAALSALVDAGADGAGYFTRPEGQPERVVASILTAEPRASDVRESAVRRPGEAGPELGPWQYVV